MPPATAGSRLEREATVTPGAAVPPPPREDLTRRALRVIPVLVFVGTCLAMVKYALQPLVNPDTFFHLRFGHEFLTGEWGLRDPGSVTTFATNEWLPTQWASQELMAWTEQNLGLDGVAVLAGVWFLAFAAAIYIAARRDASALAAAAITVLALAATQPALSARPQVLSYLLVVVFTVAWRDSQRDGRPRWWLVPLTWVWAVSHGMWPLAIVIGLVGATGALLERQHSVRARLTLFGVPAACAVAAAVTPLGPALYGAVLSVGQNSKFFSEWSSPDFGNSMSYLTATMVAATIFLRLRRPVALPWGEIGFLALAAGATLYSIRTLPVAVAIVTPLLAASLAPYLAPQPIQRWEKLTVAGALVGCVALLAVLVPGTNVRGGATPDWIDSEFTAMPAGTVVLNDWEWGGYLMWAYPQVDLVTHGYGDTFTTAELQRNSDIIAVQPGWDHMVEETGAEVALLRPESALAYALQEHLDWTMVERDEDNVALLRAPHE
ncbi:hypothetical protein GCM10009843_07410 [Nocardioides bigeumensis]|uniref:Glycosyltransferase RgtA/B/C/D-like domain-containing protein n=2 Tax=Nocardioides bigeumensis TaxID=433657 RepID=A0ABP5JLK7_9ACTN